MNVNRILASFIQSVTPISHKARRESLRSAVQSCIENQTLTVTGIGRGIAGTAKEKHRIKRADRLLSNRWMQIERPLVYAAITRLLISHLPRPVIHIDWSDLDACRGNYLLRASLAFKGRALTLYEQVYPLSKKEKPAENQRFLQRLKDILPAHCCPIVVTDSGFKVPWFKLVQQQGWDFVGRIRGNSMCHTTDYGWLSCQVLFKKARKQARAFSDSKLTHQSEYPAQLILHKKTIKGRTKVTKLGEKSRASCSLDESRSAREPWLLATSLKVGNVTSIQYVIAAYRSRMQIEEAFRDNKSARYGLSLDWQGCKCPERLAVLVLIGTLAHTLLIFIGLSGVSAGLHRQFQANTIKHRAVLSYTYLALRMINRKLTQIRQRDWLNGIREFRQTTASFRDDLHA